MSDDELLKRMILDELHSDPKVNETDISISDSKIDEQVDEAQVKELISLPVGLILESVDVRATRIDLPSGETISLESLSTIDCL